MLLVHWEQNLFETLCVHSTTNDKNVTGRTGGEGFCRGCFRGELIAQRSRTVHELDDREVLGLQIRGTTGGCVDTYIWAGWLHFGCTYGGMHASHTFRWNVGFIGLAEHMSLLCFVLAYFGLFWPILVCVRFCKFARI